MSELREGEFSLDGYPFGGEDHDVVVLPGGFRPGGWTSVTQDTNSPNGDDLIMGRDRLNPGAWSFDLATNQHSGEGAVGALNDLAGMWSSLDRRSRRGHVSVLRYRIGGRTRRVYGRARRFIPVVVGTLWQGITGAIADFQPVEATTYDDEPRSIEINSQGESAGGMTSPFIFPLSTNRTGSNNGAIGDVGGTIETPPIITIYGPITRPFVSGPGWRIDLDATIPAGQAVVIDAHPAIGTVTRSDGASLAGALTLNSRLSRVRLFPGPSAIFFGGIDPTGNARCNVAWHPAHPSF